MKTQLNVSVDGDLKTAAQRKLKFLGMSMSEFFEECLKALTEGSNGRGNIAGSADQDLQGR